MSTLTRKESRPFLDLFDWMDSPLTVFRPFTTQGMRMEDFVKDGHYTVRAELPGVDPEHEVEVSVTDGILTIRADRHEEQVDKTHSEFRCNFRRFYVCTEQSHGQTASAGGRTAALLFGDPPFPLGLLMVTATSFACDGQRQQDASRPAPPRSCRPARPGR
jgi:hypothetical protein